MKMLKIDDNFFILFKSGSSKSFSHFAMDCLDKFNFSAKSCLVKFDCFLRFASFFPKDFFSKIFNNTNQSDKTNDN